MVFFYYYYLFVSLFMVICYVGWFVYICIDLYMCMNTNIHVCPYISAYDAVVCTL